MNTQTGHAPLLGRDDVLDRVDSLLASTRNPSGAVATESPWLIHTTWSTGCPATRGVPAAVASPARRTAVEPYSRRPVCATVPPSCCAITWKP